MTFRANSKGELLERLGKNKWGSDWMYAPEAGGAMTLIAFAKANHPESKGL